MGLITFINVAIGVSLGGLLYTIWPEHYFSWYPSIPFFYWVMAMAMTFFLGLETYILYLFEKKRMKREKREKDDEYNQR